MLPISRRSSRRIVVLAVLVSVLLASALPVFLSEVAYAQDSQRHVVQPGETLFRIALKYGLSVDALARANGITNTALVYVGQVLVIPSGTPQTQPQQQPAAPQTTSISYTVQPGDTLNRIAQRFNLTWRQLMDANGLTDPNRITVGQRLVIPNQPLPPEQAAQPTAAPAQAPAAVQAVEPTVAPPAAVAQATARTHVVKRGEGLAAIGRKYGISWTTIAAANNISNPNLIYAGMVLVIPESDTAPASGPAVAPDAPNTAGKLILVVLREQRVYVYENGQLLRTTLASTGLGATPTVQGQYKIYVKYKAQTMYGPGYYLPSVPYVMYFFKGYGLHGTYWHNNFGRPMSHGCVNLPTPEAQWLFNWAEVGTPVYVRW